MEVGIFKGWDDTPCIEWLEMGLVKKIYGKLYINVEPIGVLSEELYYASTY
jgi:hypothetical protein